MNKHNSFHQTDVLVIGAGAAGLSVAIQLATQLNVTLVLKGDLPGGASYWAQGGIAVALDEEDSAQAHAEDTIIVGGGLCHPDTVQFVTSHAREQLEWLIGQGVCFTQDKQHSSHHLHLTREGGHSFRRIVHADDATGAAIQACLAKTAQQLPKLTILTHRIAIDIIQAADSHSSQAPAPCLGAYLYNEAENSIETWHSRAVVLATGGASRAWLHSTNPDVASGDGIAMAWRAGCHIANLEFNQFHPTCLFTPEPQTRSFLLTEALRGEGAHLTLADGTRFMSAYHKDAELAPRDIVARAIDTEIKKHGLDHVYLDISHRPAEFIRSHFPTIYHYCLTVGIDITRDRIPVVPAAHYTCGGIVTDLNGTTNITSLYAIGEVACTGLHGSNRIASNSLLECFVFGKAAATHILKTVTPTNHLSQAHSQTKIFSIGEHNILTSKIIEERLLSLKQIMTNHVAIVRNTHHLKQAQLAIEKLKQDAKTLLSSAPINRQKIEFHNLLLVAELIVTSALSRKESRGLHFSTDYPQTDPAQQHDTILTP